MYTDAQLLAFRVVLICTCFYVCFLLDWCLGSYEVDCNGKRIEGKKSSAFGDARRWSTMDEQQQKERHSTGTEPEEPEPVQHTKNTDDKNSQTHTVK